MAQYASAVKSYSISQKVIFAFLHVNSEKMALRGELQMAVSSSNRQTRAHGRQCLRAQVVNNMVKCFVLRSDDPSFLAYLGGGS